jgi:hypothetical protein
VLPLCSQLTYGLLEEALLVHHGAFLRTHWADPAPLLALLARAGLLLSPLPPAAAASASASPCSLRADGPAVAAVVVAHCAAHSLPALLELYLQRHFPAAGNGGGGGEGRVRALVWVARQYKCAWAEWLLLELLPGSNGTRRLAASLANARAMQPRPAGEGEAPAVPLRTVAAVVERYGVLAALAVLADAGGVLQQWVRQWVPRSYPSPCSSPPRTTALLPSATRWCSCKTDGWRRKGRKRI